MLQGNSTVNGTSFTAKLENNASARAFAALLPLTLQMKDLHGNEKYHYLKTSLPSRPEAVGHVRAGDVMLFGDDCIVIFYKTFATSYRYTPLGRFTDAVALERACRGGTVSVIFSKP
ncbi:MAG: hypothetical protein K6G15_05430 [Desulfovibrio sp.]|nr:hypothetical protein [Desulfovibrio sp.]